MTRVATSDPIPLLLVLTLGCGGGSTDDAGAVPVKDFLGDQRPFIQALQEAHQGPPAVTVDANALKRAVLTPESVEALKEILETDSENNFPWTLAARLLATQGNPELIDYLMEIAYDGYHPERRETILESVPIPERKKGHLKRLVDDAFYHPKLPNRLRAVEILATKDRQKAKEAARATIEDSRFPGRYSFLKFLSVKDPLDHEFLLSTFEAETDSTLTSMIHGKARKEGGPKEWKDFALVALDSRNELAIAEAIQALQHPAFVGDREVISALRPLTNYKGSLRTPTGGTIATLAQRALQYLERRK